MHYLLNDQSYYFPPSNDQSFPLQQFLQNAVHRLPTVVRASSSNIHERAMKNLLSRKTPLLLLSTYQFQSILSEYHDANSARRRSSLTQSKLLTKKAAKYRTMKKLSKSLITIATSDFPDDYTDDDQLKTSTTLVRKLHEKQSAVIPLCRIPLHYRGYFELLNENNHAIEPFRRVSDLLIVECHRDERHRTVRTKKWPQVFFLRSQCRAYTRRHGLDEGKLSGSADSCYGSLSDLDPLILHEDEYLLQPGQVVTIFNPCSAYRTTTSGRESKTDSLPTQLTTASWLRSKSRMLFPRKKSNSSLNQFMTDAPTKHVDDVSKVPECFLRCQTEEGDIVYISAEETGLFSPIYTPTRRGSSIPDSENIDISGVFQLKQLLSNFRFPISVRLLNQSITFEHIYSPASSTLSESIDSTATKFRLLLPYTEQVVFACPLVLPSSLKSHTVVIPIPIDSDIEVQRCLNMRELTKNGSYHQLIEKCSGIIKQYQTEISYIHFPLVLNAPTRRPSSRKEPLFKKRSQSESHLDHHALDLSKETYGKSCGALDDDDFQRPSVKSIRQHSAGNLNELDPKKSVLRQRSSYHANLKIDKPRPYSRQQEHDSDDENYQDVDHIYDYIRSGDITDDVQKIQAKEQVYNTKANQMASTWPVCVSAVPNVSNPDSQRLDKQLPPRCGSAKTKRVRRFPSSLDDSRPLDDKSDHDDDTKNESNDKSHDYHSGSRQNSHTDLADASQPKSIIRMKRISKH